MLFLSNRMYKILLHSGEKRIIINGDEKNDLELLVFLGFVKRTETSEYIRWEPNERGITYIRIIDIINAQKE